MKTKRKLRLASVEYYRWVRPRLFLCGCLSIFSGSAFATTELVLQLETSLSSDTNPFRFYDTAPVAPPDAANLPNVPNGTIGTSGTNGISKTSDTSTGVDLRVGAVIPLLSDRTRLILTGSLGNHHYKNYRELDHHTGAGDASLEWVTGSLLNGRVTAGKEDRLFQYINGSLTDKDISHQTRSSAEVSMNVTDDWTVQAKFDRSGLTYDLPVNQLYNFDASGKQLGIRYRVPTGSSIEVGSRWSESHYPDRTEQQIADLDQRYKETELYLDGEWKYSVKSVTSAHFGVIRRQYESLAERNTNLFNALWRGTYYYSPKLRLDLQFWDRPFSIVDPAILYVVTKAVRFDAQWKWTDRTQFNLSGLLQNSDQQLIPRLSTLAEGVSRKEKLQRLGVGANFQIERGFRLFFDSFYEKVSRDPDGLNLKQGVVKIGLEYTYENLPGSAARMGLNRYQQSLSATDALR
ncbi:hypothetical protein ACO0LB_07165 [Undibacterium sp. SXout7W]|uniref:hypothetical protein n=1 Tax=Undibacterium sp. SXout7W TaxID=3413049 RepID=UPI003BEFA19C